MCKLKIADIPFDSFFLMRKCGSVKVAQAIYNLLKFIKIHYIYNSKNT